MQFLSDFSIPHLAIILIVLLFFVGPWFLIFKKAGYGSALGLIMIIPIVGFLAIWWFALADWPVSKHNLRKS